MATEIHYQMFESYYHKAVEAEDKGNQAEAKQLYYSAGESLLKAAKQLDGNMKRSLLERADKIFAIADSIEIVKKESTAERAASSGQDNREHASKDGAGKDEETSIWKSAGKTNIHFDDIAGLQDVKDSIRRRIIQPRLRPDLYEAFRRKVSGGILLYGPPGTGKTMIAKAIATEVDAEFFSIRCSDIVGKYFGESEKNIKSLFEAARKEESSVIFFDEFEALASQRGSDSPVMNRLVPELLSQMDGFQTEEKNNIMVLAATNRPWDIDSAFMRPPRLTEKIYVGLPDAPAREFLVLKAFRDVPVSADVRVDDIVRATEGYNASDVVTVCETMKDFAIDRSIAEKEICAVSKDDVRRALDKIHSSVQKQDIERIREWEKAQE